MEMRGWGVLHISTRAGWMSRIFLLEGWGYLWKHTTRLGDDQDSPSGMDTEENFKKYA